MFVGSVRAWIRGFRRLSLRVRRLECWFVSSLLERWFNVLIFCFQCFADCGCCGFFFFSDVMDFISDGEKEEGD